MPYKARTGRRVRYLRKSESGRPWNSPGQNTGVDRLSPLGSSQPRDRTQVSRTAGRFFTSWATREAHVWVWFYAILSCVVSCNCPTVKLQNCHHHPFGVSFHCFCFSFGNICFSRVFTFTSWSIVIITALKFFDNCNICLILVFASLVFSPKNRLCFLGSLFVE